MEVVMEEVILKDLKFREALCKFFLKVLFEEGDRANPLWGPAVDEYQRQLAEIQAKMNGKLPPVFVQLKPAKISAPVPKSTGE
jgi:hypothetical protein